MDREDAQYVQSLIDIKRVLRLNLILLVTSSIDTYSVRQLNVTFCKRTYMKRS